MKVSWKTMLRSVVGASAFAFSFAALAQADVHSELVAYKLVRKSTGELATAPATEVKPGDTVVYTATYSNTGSEAARELVATVPVPVGMDYVGSPAGEKYAPSLASLDGKVFAAVPLTRRVPSKVKPGTTELQDVPLSEYRFMRWKLAELAAGAKVSLKVTAKVNASSALN